MTEFTDEYLGLLIKQYYDKPNASAEIVAKSVTWETIRDVLADFPSQFDIDSQIIEAELGLFDGSVLGLFDGSVLGMPGQSAIGDRLDIIGKIVGLSRMGLGDETYRLLLKVKIAQNNASAFMTSDDRISIQDVIILAFNGEGYVTDKQDMSLSLYINSTSITPTLINLILDAKILPKPQGVRYDVTASTEGLIPFGFAELNQTLPADVLGFAELNYAPEDGGAFAELYGS